MHRATAGDLPKVPHRALDVFAEAAALEHERVRRWARLHTVQAAFHGRRRGFRRVRQVARLDRLVALADHLAVLFTEAESR